MRVFTACRSAVCLHAGLAIFSSAVFGEEAPLTTQSFSLEMAARRTLLQSPAVKISQSEMDRREGLREQASGEFDWSVTGAATQTKQRLPSVDSFGRDTVDTADTTSYSVGSSRKFRNGISVQPSTSVTVVDQNAPVAPTYGNSQLNLQILVPLLRGLGETSAGANEAAARGDLEVARLLYRHVLSSQVLSTVQAYWSARSAHAAWAVRRDDEIRAKKLHEGMRVLVDTRLFAPNFLLQSEANLRLKATNSREAELTAFEATFELSRTMGLPPAELAVAKIPDQSLPTLAVVNDPVSNAEVRSQWITRALNQRADYLAQRKSEVPLRILTRAAQSDLKPQLDLNVQGGYAGLNRGNNLVQPLTRRLTGANGEIGLSFAWPLANTYQRGLLRTRRAAQNQAEWTTVQVQSDIAAEVCSAVEEIRLRAETMDNAIATVGIARKAVEQEQRRLQNGEASVLDVINLENLLSSARLSEIDAQAGYAVAIAKLRFAVGEIFLPEKSDHSFQLADLSTPPGS